MNREYTDKTVKLPELRYKKEKWEHEWMYDIVHTYWGIVQIVIFTMGLTALGLLFIGLFSAILIQVFMMFQVQIGTLSFLIILGFICAIGGYVASNVRKD